MLIDPMVWSLCGLGKERILVGEGGVKGSSIRHLEA